jgi:hypothetical protein
MADKSRLTPAFGDPPKPALDGEDALRVWIQVHRGRVEPAEFRLQIENLAILSLDGTGSGSGWSEGKHAGGGDKSLADRPVLVEWKGRIGEGDDVGLLAFGLVDGLEDDHGIGIGQRLAGPGVGLLANAVQPFKELVEADLDVAGGLLDVVNEGVTVGDPLVRVSVHQVVGVRAECQRVDDGSDDVRNGLLAKLGSLALEIMELREERVGVLVEVLVVV